jgi:dTDP-4-dehydrorhamnose reductase
MRLLVTGAAGMLGQDVVRAAESAGHDAIALPRGDLDITDGDYVERALSAERPDAVVNCAAWTDVDGAEEHEAAAYAVNAVGAGHVAAATAAAGARLVHVSTDYVFDGRADRPYVESAATAPMSAYGRTKLAGERAVAQAGGRPLIVRSSWLFGVGGKNFVATMLALADGRDHVSVVTDQIGCPTWTGHLAPALVALAAQEQQGAMHVAGAGACSWHELASEAFRRAGVACEVRETTTAEMPRPAPRPAYSVLVSERPDAPRLPDWREGVAGFLAARAGAPA